METTISDRNNPVNCALIKPFKNHVRNHILEGDPREWILSNFGLYEGYRKSERIAAQGIHI